MSISRTDLDTADGLRVCSRGSCRKSGEPQSLELFRFDTKLGRHDRWCKKCKSAVAKESEIRNKEKCLLRKAAWHKEKMSTDPQYAESVRANHRRFHDKPDSKIKARNRYLRKAQSLDWAQERSDYARTYAQNKTAEQKEATRVLDREKYRKDKTSGKHDAGIYVLWAGRLGLLIKTGICTRPEVGGRPCFGKTEWHHYKGYAKEHWLVVEEVCARHHGILDFERRKAEQG